MLRPTPRVPNASLRITLLRNAITTARQNTAREAAANVLSAQAALERAKINLTYTNIVAPVAGRVSRAEMTLGNVVSTGANAPVLTTLVSLSPIYASFDVDEQTYLRYLSRRERL